MNITVFGSNRVILKSDLLLKIITFRLVCLVMSYIPVYKEFNFLNDTLHHTRVKVCTNEY